MRIAISPEELALLSKYVHAHSGILLDEGKAYLFESRLAPLLDELGCGSYRELLDKAQRDHTGKTRGRLVDAMATNETSFFRDKSPFDLVIQKIAPDFFERKPSAPFRIWSAACSTGQEPYSLLMALMDAAIRPPKFDLRVTATDISDDAISKASRGSYSKFELARGLDAGKLHKYFDKDGDNWRIKDELRAIVHFKRLNLLDPAALAALGRFDLILCRNVAIYFSPADKTRLFNALAALLDPAGALIIGSTESLLGVTERFAKQTFRGMVYYTKAAGGGA